MSTTGNGDVLIDTKIVQVSNVAPQANKDQLQTLFGYVGKIDELKLYPSARDMSSTVQVRICFIKFTDSANVGVAQHMTNTVFIDRALIVAPFFGPKIPDEMKGLEIMNTGSSYGGITEPKLPPTVTNQVDGIPPNQVIQTFDPRLSLHNLPPYPPLPASTDSRRVEEIRRTLVAINLDPLLSAQEMIDFFSAAGEVKYFRFCSREGDPIRYAMVEFTEQESIVGALKLNNKQLGENILKVHHATQAIVKPVPQNKSNEAAQKEIEEAVNRVKEAQQSILSTVITPEPEKEKEKKRSKSRSPSRSRNRSTSRRRSGSRSRKRRSRSRSRRRSHSRSKDRRKRSRSRDKRRRSKSRDRSRKSRSKSRSRSRSRRERRDRSKEREKKDKDKDKDKERDKKDREKKKKDKKEKERSPAREGSIESRDRERKKKSRSPSKSKKSRRSRSGSRGRSR